MLVRVQPAPELALVTEPPDPEANEYEPRSTHPVVAVVKLMVLVALPPVCCMVSFAAGSASAFRTTKTATP